MMMCKQDYNNEFSLNPPKKPVCQLLKTLSNNIIYLVLFPNSTTFSLIFSIGRSRSLFSVLLCQKQSLKFQYLVFFHLKDKFSEISYANCCPRKVEIFFLSSTPSEYNFFKSALTPKTIWNS